MPRFVTKGPVVPDELVQELEDDRVVVFCGAGISMGAGLPSYIGLVAHCYKELGRPLPPDKSNEWGWPDRMLGALENGFGTQPVRSIVADRLSQLPTDLELHKAILRLSRLRLGDGTRLVTTNFDTFFEQAQEGMLLGKDFHSGPVLPIPRNDHIVSWRSIVYLHGRLETLPARNDHLVLTSADFGRAYLTDAWAARFVAKLFADFTVLFIGYSLNDPVLRYMTDAFAAEDAMTRRARARGPAYIFMPYKGPIPDAAAYKQRNLEPIFYNEARNHSQLKKTLIAWADAREDYLANTTVLINRIAPNRPASLDPSDTANLLWAVAGRPEDEGHGARVFAGIKPTPPIEWFDELERREHDAHSRFEKIAAASRAAAAPLPEPPLTPIGDLFPPAADHRDLNLSPTSFALVTWISQHLHEVGLVERIVAKLESGRRLHRALRRAIRKHLLADHGLLDGFSRFWRIVAAEGDWATSDRAAVPLTNARDELNTSHEEAWLKQEVLAGLRPVLKLKRSFYRPWPDAAGVLPPPETIGKRLGEIADAEVSLADEHNLELLLRIFDGKPYKDAFWADLVGDLTTHLKRVFDLLSVAGEASPETDMSSLHRPSIVPHAQNRHHKKWGHLFDLIWQGWLYLDANDEAASRHHIEQWRHIRYPAFERLALAAINHTAHMTPNEKLEALLHA